MKKNVGGLDRVLRVVLGLAIFYAGYTYHSWWGAIGILPILTAVVSFCPAYLPFGFSTCKKGTEKGCGCGCGGM